MEGQRQIPNRCVGIPHGQESCSLQLESVMSLALHSCPLAPVLAQVWQFSSASWRGLDSSWGKPLNGQMQILCLRLSEATLCKNHELTSASGAKDPWPPCMGPMLPSCLPDDFLGLPVLDVHCRSRSNPPKLPERCGHLSPPMHSPLTCVIECRCIILARQ